MDEDLSLQEKNEIINLSKTFKNPLVLQEKTGVDLLQIHYILKHQYETLENKKIKTPNSEKKTPNHKKKKLKSDAKKFVSEIDMEKKRLKDQIKLIQLYKKIDNPLILRRQTGMTLLQIHNILRNQNDILQKYNEITIKDGTFDKAASECSDLLKDPKTLGQEKRLFSTSLNNEYNTKQVQRQQKQNNKKVKEADNLKNITIPMSEQINLIKLSKNITNPIDLQRETGINILQIHYILQHKNAILQQWSEDQEAFDLILLQWVRHYRKKNVSPTNMSNIAKQARYMSELLEVNYSIRPNLWSQIDEITNQQEYHIDSSTKLSIYKIHTILKNDGKSRLKPHVYERVLVKLERYLRLHCSGDSNSSVTNKKEERKKNACVIKRSSATGKYDKQIENKESKNSANVTKRSSESRTFGKHKEKNDSSIVSRDYYSDDDDVIPIENPILHIDLSNDDAEICNDVNISTKFGTQNSSISSKAKKIKLEPQDNFTREVITQQKIKLEPNIKTEITNNCSKVKHQEIGQNLGEQILAEWDDDMESLNEDEFGETRFEIIEFKTEEPDIKIEASNIKIEPKEENVTMPEENTCLQSVKFEKNDDDHEEIPIIYNYDLYESNEDDTNFEGSRQELLKRVKNEIESVREDDGEKDEAILEILSDDEDDDYISEIKDILTKRKNKTEPNYLTEDGPSTSREAKNSAPSKSNAKQQSNVNIPSTTHGALRDKNKTGSFKPELLKHLQGDSSSSINKAKHTNNDNVPSTSNAVLKGNSLNSERTKSRPCEEVCSSKETFPYELFKHLIMDKN